MYTHTRARAKRGAEGGYFRFGNNHLLVTCRLVNLFQYFKDWKEIVDSKVDSETWDNLGQLGTTWDNLGQLVKKVGEINNYLTRI